MPDPYIYRVVDVLRVVDGDTLDVKLSLGFGLTAAFRFRLAGVDAPEVYGPNASPAGRAAADYVTGWLADRAGRLYARTYKGADTTVGIGDGAFGRWLADFTCDDGDSLADDLTAHLAAPSERRTAP